MLDAASIEVPIYPHAALGGGNVIAELQIVSGRVEKVIVHSDEGAFADACRDALMQWRFQPDHNGRELVAVHFRHPAFFSFDDADQDIRPANVHESLPYPLSIRRPVYPVNVVARGGVVLRVDISAEGKVSDVEVLRGLGGLTETSVNAVREWTFRPAKDRMGKHVPSQAYALFVYRFPVIAQPRD